MSRLTDALDALVEQHRRLGSSIPDFLRPGLEPADARRSIEAIGLDPPDDIAELFGWHDGFDQAAWASTPGGAGFPRLWGDTYFARLDGAIVEYGKALQIERVSAQTELMAYGRVITSAAIWRESWFPVFSGGDETYAEDCAAGPGRGRIFDVHWHPGGSDEPIRPRFASLTALAEAVVRRFEQGAYAWNAGIRFLDERRDVLERLERVERAEAGGLA